MAKKNTLIHLHSDQLNGAGNGAKLPQASDLAYGEIAINYKDGYETISLKNSSDNIVSITPITVDDSLSETSTNPIENKVVTETINEEKIARENADKELSDKINSLGSAYRYKGTVNSKDELLNITMGSTGVDVSVGDVYNVSVDIVINEKNYPAGTNFASLVDVLKGTPTTENDWDSLGGTIDLTDINNQLTKINEKLFPLSISVTGGGLFKKGTTNNVTVNWAIKYGDDVVQGAGDLTSLTINNEELDKSLRTKQFTGITTTTSYTVKVAGRNMTAQGNVNATFANPNYCGVVASDFIINESNITNLSSGELLRNSRSYTFSNYNATAQKVCYAYPASFGNLTNILDANGFKYLDSFNKTTLEVNGETYNVYLMKDAFSITNGTLIFS